MKDNKEIPEFKSYEEEAQWWDTHDVLDYLDPTFKPIVSPGNKNARSLYTKEAIQFIEKHDPGRADTLALMADPELQKLLEEGDEDVKAGRLVSIDDMYF